MSADRWSHCHKCSERARKRKADAEKKVEKAYGKVSADEFLRMRTEAEAMSDAPPEETLREDYSIWMDEGVFRVDYTARCTACGFQFNYEHEQKAEAQP